MNKLKTEKILTIINFVIVGYFAIIYLFYYYQIDFVLLGVFREMLTIPFMFGQLGFLVFGIYFVVKEKRFRFLLLLSIVLLAVCSVLTIGSFFF